MIINVVKPNIYYCILPVDFCKILLIISVFNFCSNHRTKSKCGINLYSFIFNSEINFQILLKFVQQTVQNTVKLKIDKVKNRYNL